MIRDLLFLLCLCVFVAKYSLLFEESYIDRMEFQSLLNGELPVISVSVTASAASQAWVGRAALVAVWRVKRAIKATNTLGSILSVTASL